MYLRLFTYILLLFFSFTAADLRSWEDPAFDESNFSPQALEFLLEAKKCEVDRDYRAAIYYLQLLEEEIKTSPDPTVPPFVYFRLGENYLKSGKYENALDHLLPIIENPNSNKILQAQSLTAVAQAYHKLGEINLAHDFGMRAVERREELNDKLGLLKDLYNLGTLFYYQDNYKEASEYYNRAYVLAQELNDSRYIYNTTSALGLISQELGQITEAVKYTEESLRMAQETDYTLGVSYALHNYGSIFALENDHEKALEYFNRSLNIKKENGDDWGIVGDYIAIGHSHTELKQYDAATENLKEALRRAKQNRVRVRVLEAEEALARVYEKTGNIYAEAFTLRNVLTLRDSMLTETAVEEMGSRKAAYAMQKKESEIQKLQSEKLILEGQQEIARLRWYLGLGAFVLAGMVAIGLYFHNRRQKNVLALVQEKHHEIEEKNEKIQIQNKLLEQSNTELQNFAYVASHDLKEPLRMVSSFSGLLKKRYDTVLDERGNEYMYYITDAVERMNALLDDLLDYSRVNTSDKDLEKINTGNIAAKVKLNLTPVLEEKAGTLEIPFDKMPELLGNKSQFSQLLQNLISNGLKFHNGKDPLVKVDCEERKSDYLFSVKDNGIGISEENQKKIFDMFTRLHTREQYEGTGIGLSTCKKIVERHGGTIWVESKQGEGSTFLFTVKK